MAKNIIPSKFQYFKTQFYKPGLKDILLLFV